MTGIAHVSNLVQFTIETTKQSPETIFSLLANAGISVDFINIFPHQVVFTLVKHEAELAKIIFSENNIAISTLEDCAKVAVVGAGITGVPGVTAKIVTSLAAEDIAILQSADSYTTIWILVSGENLQNAVCTLHDVFL